MAIPLTSSNYASALSAALAGPASRPDAQKAYLQRKRAAQIKQISKSLNNTIVNENTQPLDTDTSGTNTLQPDADTSGTNTPQREHDQPFTDPASATSDAGYNYNTDPVLTQIKQSNVKRRADADAVALAERARLKVQFGGDATGDLYTQAGKANPQSVYGQLARGHKEGVRSLEESANKANLGYSSERFYQLGREGDAYLGRLQGAATSQQDALAQIAKNLLNIYDTANTSDQSALGDAYTRSLTRALKNDTGAPPPTTPPKPPPPAAPGAPGAPATIAAVEKALTLAPVQQAGDALNRMIVNKTTQPNANASRLIASLRQAPVRQAGNALNRMVVNKTTQPKLTGMPAVIRTLYG